MDKRVKLVQRKLFGNKIGALLVTNYHNIFYLTGFQTLAEREAYVVVTNKEVYLMTDERYIPTKLKFKIQISNEFQNPNFQIRVISSENKLTKHLLKILEDEKINKLGFEEEDLKYGEYIALKEKLKAELVSISQLILRLRETKEDEGD